MNDITLLLLIVIALGVLLLIYALIYNHFQIYIIKINTVENNIDDTLRDKFDLLNKGINLIEESDQKKEELEKLNTLKDLKLSNFDLDRKLIEINSFLFQSKEKYPKLNNLDSFNKVLIQLSDNDEQLAAYKNYYNDNIIKFNRLVRMFPSNIVGKISKFEEKLFYDGKDMSDEDTEDFKL